MNSRPKVPWSAGDKLLMIVLCLVLPLAIGMFLWFRALSQTPDITVPTPTMPATNARDYYIAASNAILEDKKIEDARASLTSAGRLPDGQLPPSLGDKEKLVAENAGAIQTLHVGFQYPYQEPPSRSFNTSFPHYQKIRGLARFLALQAQVDAERGDWDGAASADLDAIQMGETMPHGGPLIGMLVGVACQSIGRKQAWAAAGHLSAAQARAGARRLSQIRTQHVPYAATMQEEEWAGQASLLELMSRPDWAGELASAIAPDPSGGQGGNSLGREVFVTRLRLIGKRRILADYTQTLDRMIADARQPFAARSPIPAVSPVTNPISDMLTPSFGNMRLNEANADTQNALLLATLTLRAYRLDHGTYPTALAALTPGYLQAIPADPFALSGPLHYKRSGAKYLLYSVGPDGKDDGGAAIFDRTKPAPTTIGGSDQRRYVMQDSQGDIVAGVNTN